jgi:hypothetical protein
MISRAKINISTIKFSHQQLITTHNINQIGYDQVGHEIYKAQWLTEHTQQKWD